MIKKRRQVFLGSEKPERRTELNVSFIYKVRNRSHEATGDCEMLNKNTRKARERNTYLINLFSFPFYYI